VNTNPQFQDRTLTCADCGASFTFSAGEQRYFQEKGFTDEPKRCLACRKKKRERREEQHRLDAQPKRGYGTR